VTGKQHPLVAAASEPFEIAFTVPGVPRGKEHQGARIVTPKDGKPFIHHYTKTQTRSEEGGIKYFANIAMQGRPPMNGPLVVQLCAYVPIPMSFSRKKTAAALAGEIFPISRPDWDNYAEMLDSLNGVVWTDDARVVEAHVYKRYSDRPRLSVIVKPKLPTKEE